nr:nitrogenase component 1 [Methanospirillum stamsii]
MAVYGKGGIGKSTISANTSAALAEKGHRVLQIGCDPKHDSTRLLLGGKIPMTALSYIKTQLPKERRAEEIVFRGYGNVACVEAGGPEPGVGCAGRGVITTFELLEDLGVSSDLFDLTLYDVLGDVVCGGFAVPIRNEYADAVYIVTSGEYLSLYAANNILKGILNFTERGPRIAGIIHNARGDPDEEERVRRFAGAVRLPVVIRVPRSEIFARAERTGCTLIEGHPDSEEAEVFRTLAVHAEDIMGGGALLHHALPLSDEDLEEIVLQRNDSRTIHRFSFCQGEEKDSRKAVSVSVKNKKPLIGCAFAGAVSVTAQVSDAVTIMHCPRSCTLMMYEKLLDTRQHSTTRFGSSYQQGLMERLISTDMRDEDFIFGGEKKLQETLDSVIRDGCKLIFVVTACPPGIIGDDIGKVISTVIQGNPDVRIIPVKVDGNLVGDFVQGVMDGYGAVAGLIDDKTEKTNSPSVNLIAEKWLAENEERSYQAVRDLLGRLGIGVNCRFLINTDSSSLKNFNKAGLVLPADKDDTVESIREMLTSRSSLPFLDLPLPTGFFETKQWLLEVSRVFGMEEKAKEIIAEEEARYQEQIRKLRHDMEGKTILISTYPKSLDWVLDIASDLGMKILKIGLTYSPFSESFRSRYADAFPIVHSYSIEMRSEDISELKPDLVLYTYPTLRRSDEARSAHIPYAPGFGFQVAIERAKKWNLLMKLPVSEGWKKDGEGII